MLVKAAPGLQVPKEGHPRRYITEQEAVSVEASAYYIRLVSFGDLIKVAATAAETAVDGDKKSAKKGAQ